jgi:DNA invertase Pin-like site-specific DNA recombinase
MEKQYFGYIRVSTAKQGEKGVSLQEQQGAIQQYAQRYNLTVVEWFEERESAAKRGRPIFAQMMRKLRQGKVQGVIIHKIDRSARNLKDWADLGELIDSGVEVHFANESLDLNTRGGRLSADIQAVVASDYIRNLREETRKGFYGRLKQGLYPLPAPLGYLDRGKGRVKDVDPVMSPVVAKAFELYSSQRYSLHRLLGEVGRMGLRNRRGAPISLTGLSTILNNPFYIGLVRVKRTGELFPGAHRPLVSKTLFDRVQMILEGKTVDRQVRHHFTYRRLVRCAACGRSLIGELQKGHVYYRCQTRECPTKTIREEVIESAMTAMMAILELDEEELGYVREWMEDARLHQDSLREDELQNAKFRLDAVRSRLNRLTDAFIDGILEKRLFEERKAALIVEEREIRERIHDFEAGNGLALRKLEEFLELIKNAPFLYKNASPDEKRDLVRNLFSNLKLIQKNVSVEPKISVQTLVNRPKISNGAPSRSVSRTWNRILKKLLKQFSESGEVVMSTQASAAAA